MRAFQDRQDPQAATTYVFTTSDNMRVTPSLLKRSLWKGPNIVPLPIVRAKPGEKPAPIKTQARAADILPSFVGLTFLVHNGKTYHTVTVTDSMVGHKLGEFSPTRKQFKYKQTKNK